MRSANTSNVANVANVPNFDIEQRLHEQGYLNIAGVDEVGRGCLAGPVVAAAVVLDQNFIPTGINDSKKLSVARRQAVYLSILAHAKSVAIATICAEHIDQINIRQASLKAMTKAVLALDITADYVLIDGIDALPKRAIEQMPIVKGDQTSLSIAAASIVAKVSRDNMLAMVGTAYPSFGFGNHVGYATKQHRQALLDFAPIKSIHRFSFSPIKT